MRSSFAVAAAMTVAGAASAAPPGSAIYTVTYIEVVPQAAQQALGLLRAEAAASRSEEGCQAISVLGEVRRDDRLVIFAVTGYTHLLPAQEDSKNIPLSPRSCGGRGKGEGGRRNKKAGAERVATTPSPSPLPHFVGARAK